MTVGDRVPSPLPEGVAGTLRPVYPSGATGAPPGWYPDPAGMKAWRWWDGTTWTVWASDPVPPGPTGVPFRPTAFPLPPVPAALPITSVGDWLASEERVAPWARRAFFYYPVVVVAGLVVAWAEGSILRQTLHMLRVDMQPGVTRIQTDTSRLNLLNLLSLVDLVVSAPFFVLVLVWQYHAARTAQLLGLPASRSPGLGVGSWFIPVVNFWFPYQSIRDCLPPGDQGRSAVARLWAWYVSTLVLLVVTDIAALVGSRLALATAAAALAAGIGFGRHGARSVRLITEAHRRAVPGP